MNTKTAAAALLLLALLGGCGDGAASQPPSPPAEPVVSGTQPQIPPEAEVDGPPPELGNAVWTDSSMPEGEGVKYYSFDNGSYVEYPSEADFLAAFGFAGAAPFYEYSLERTVMFGEGEEIPCAERTRLYYSEGSGTGCVVEDSVYGGKSHKWGSELDRVEQAGEDTQEQWGRWAQDPCSVPGLEKVRASGEIEDYREQREYDGAGRLVSFQADGRFASPWTNEEGRNPVASLSLTYDEDGTLRERDLFRNDSLFGSTRMNQHSYYDGLGRVCYETCYITHGQEKFFYIYPDEGPAPAWCLYIDHGGSGVILAKYG